jgi:hypothetical protein
MRARGGTMFSWFDAREARQFGIALADGLAKNLASNERKHGTAAKRNQLLQRVFVQVRQFNQTHKLNFYKKAKIGTSFKWKLLELGFEPKFVDELTHELMLRISA